MPCVCSAHTLHCAAHTLRTRCTYAAHTPLCTSQAFDWTLQDARGANNPAQLRQMQAQYGLYCIAPRTLEQDGIQLENIVCYRNRGYRKRDAKRGICLENCLVRPRACSLWPRACSLQPL